MSDQEQAWLRKAKAGDQEAFGMLVEQYQIPVYNLCYRVLGDPIEADDAAQEAFLRAYRAMDQFDLERSFLNWILTIASNHCIDRHRRKRLPTLPLGFLRGSAQPQDTSAGPERSLMNAEQHDQLISILESLSAKDRSMIVMFYWQDFSLAEIAKAHSMSVGAVKSRLHRSRRKLAKAWSEQSVEPVTAGGAYDEPSVV